MLKGYLVYDKDGAVRNAWFISRLIEVCYQLDVELKFVHPEQLESLSKADFAIVRTNNANNNKILEDKGIRVFNNYFTSKIANDKYETYNFARQLKIPVMPTFLEEQNSFPVIIKSVNGHGGTEVYLANTALEQENIKSKLKGKKIIFQKPSSTLGKDVRVYVLGGKILSAVERSSEESFKSNFSLGGKANLTKITGKIKKYVKKIVKNLNCDFVGIDFIFDNGKPVLNEIEDPVGCRMLYSLTEIDVATELISYIVKKLS
jgi:RimK family alpha-L-glutamate ligase